MKNKKRGITFAVVFIGMMLFIACENVTDSPKNHTPVESGYGRISISIAEGETAQQDTESRMVVPYISRTVLPSKFFDKYVYTFTKKGEAAGTEQSPDDGGFFTLKVGTYTVTVNAYVGDSDTLVASGVSEEFTVGSGTNDPVKITLFGIVSGAVGELNYTITYPAGAEAVITLQKWPEMKNYPLSPGNMTEGNGITETLELDSGSYLLTVFVLKNGLYTGVSEAVHISPLASTVYTRDFDDSDLLAMMVSTTAQWEIALATIKNGGNGTPENPKTYIIVVSGDVPVNGNTVNTFGDVNNVVITIEGNGKLYLASTGSLLRIGDNQAYQTVYIDSEELTLQGLKSGQNGFSQNNSSSAIYVASNGTLESLELRNGTISNNSYSYNSSSSGSGVYVASNGTFIMKDGKISGNTASSYYSSYGGGVYVASDGTFTMEGGKISGNSTSYGGGVYVGGTFTMEGGEISGNNASYGGGVSIDSNGTFIKSGNSTITGYASDTVNGNKASSQGQGHAVYGGNSTTKSLDSTVGPGVNLDSKIYGAAGGWNDYIVLTADTWADGAFTSSNGGEQWFGFTATTAVQFIHASFGTLNSSNGLYVQVYDSDGAAVGDRTQLYSSTKYTFRTVTIEQIYFIKVTRNSSNNGTYQIAFKATPSPPGITVAALTADTWVDGTITSPTDEQWFRFTATADTQYLHAAFGTLGSSSNTAGLLNVQVYDSNGVAVGDRASLTTRTRYISRTVTTGQEYYVKVTLSNSSNNGTYQIAFNATWSPPGVAILTANTWADGTITEKYGTQWFKFTATADTQYIHANFGTLTNLYVSVYNSSGTLVGADGTDLSTNTSSIFRTVEIGKEYYVWARPSSYNYTGTYKIAFNVTVMPPVTVVTTLTANTWADGNLPSSSGEQWFKFSATAATQYIHASFGTLDSLYVQVYNSSGAAVGDRTRLYSSTTYISRTVTAGQEYYIRVTPYSSSAGTYKIAFNTAWQPPSVATELTADTWVNGDLLSSSSEQWFKFSATASTQYIHASFGTLDYSNGLYVQVYNSSGTTVGNKTQLYSSTKYITQTVTEGQEYYIKVTPYNSSSTSTNTGTYRIAFNSTVMPPVTDVTTLTANTWADGTIPSSFDEKWFKFSATAAATQYIHVSLGTLDPSNGLYVQVYDSSGATVGSQSRLNADFTYISSTVTIGQTYFIRVMPSSSSTGTYKIAFNSTVIPPGPITVLTANTWADGAITSSVREQWFKFEATAATQYIHASFGTLNSSGLYVQVYNSSGTTVGSQTRLDSSTRSISPTVTAGQECYIKVQYYSSYGTYQITFNATELPPVTAAAVTALTADTWFGGNLPSSSSEQWFKFSATAAAQYLHVSFDTLDSTSYSSGGLFIQVYSSSGATVGERTRLYSQTKYISRTVEIEQEYYIRVTPYSSSTGTYKIAFNTAWLPPSSAAALTADTWADGNLPSSSSEQWFKFYATAATQYIHASFGTMNSSYGLYVQVYNTSGDTVGERTRLNSDTRSISRPVTAGQECYIKVTPYNSSSTGTYRIAFNATVIPPGAVVTTLTANTWADGNLPSSSDEQWFKFEATAATQYLHASFGTLTELNVQVYDSSGAPVESQISLYNSYRSISRTVTNEQVYYIRVRPYSSSYSGTYKIAFNATELPPVTAAAVTALTANTWVNGDIPSSLYGEQWFKFSATADPQYIHASFGTLNSSSGGLYIQVYDSDGATVGSQTRLYSNTKLISRTVTAGEEYYIRVTLYSSSSTGTYQIAFNTVYLSPDYVITPLVVDTLGEGNITSSSGEQWFKFSATAATQYIHVYFNTLEYLYVQVYTTSGTAVGDRTGLGGIYRFCCRTVNVGQEYFIKVTVSDSSSGGTYKIMFNSTIVPPEITVTELTTANTWFNGEIPSLPAERCQWFKFTATAATQYLHFNIGANTGLYILVYDSSGTMVGPSSNGITYNTDGRYISRSVIKDQKYFIKVGPYSGSYTGTTYKIAFNTSTTPPSP